MATHDIAPENWAAFFNDLSRHRQGALVTIDTVSPQDGREHEARALPLVGISLETKGSGADSIEILLGTEPEDHLTHTIQHPTHVYHKTGAGIMSDEVEHDEAVEITAPGDPPVTYLRFHPAPGQ